LKFLSVRRGQKSNPRKFGASATKEGANPQTSTNAEKMIEQQAKQPLGRSDMNGNRSLHSSSEAQ